MDETANVESFADGVGASVKVFGVEATGRLVTKS